VVAAQGAHHEAIHPAAIQISNRVPVAVWPSLVHEGRIVERTDAATDLRVGDAHGRAAVSHRDPIGAGERTEVRIERPVLLHDDDDVLDLVDAGEARSGHGVMPIAAHAPATSSTTARNAERGAGRISNLIRRVGHRRSLILPDRSHALPPRTAAVGSDRGEGDVPGRAPIERQR
jgi:hypothetical protein